MSTANIKMTQNPAIASRAAATAAKPAETKATAAKPAAPKPTAQTPATVVSLNRAPAPALPTYTAAGTKGPTSGAGPQPSAAGKSAPQATASQAAATKSATDGALYSSGDQHVVVDIMSSDSGYQNKIYWSADNWATRNYIGVDNNVSSVDIGSFAKGTKIQFAIDNGQGDFFKAGPASGNADNYEHARVTSGPSGVTIGFEDLKGGGDQDFNDAIIRVRGLSSGQDAPAASPVKLEPVVQAPKPVAPAPVQKTEPTPRKPDTKDNRSGLADGTNPGQGAGRVNSPNTGTKNPNESTKAVSGVQQAADPRIAIIDSVKKAQPSTVKSPAVVRKV